MAKYIAASVRNGWSARTMKSPALTATSPARKESRRDGNLEALPAQIVDGIGRVPAAALAGRNHPGERGTRPACSTERRFFNQ